jgi:hypothetical protein
MGSRILTFIYPGLRLQTETLAIEKEYAPWSIIPEHIPLENRGVDPEKRNTPVEKA